jgi:tetratricopeptide (TPR) repeat protein
MKKTKKKKYMQALRAFEEAIRINRNCAEAWVGKGLCRFKLGQYQNSLDDFDRAIKIDPNLTEAHTNLGDVLLNLGNLGRAYEKAEDALEIDHSHAPALRLKGRIKIEEHNYLGACEYFKRAIACDLGNPLLFLWHSYSRYLSAEFRFESQDNRYQEEMHSIIRTLHRVEELAEISGKKEVMAHVLFFSGYFFYKCQDFLSAKEKLKQCVKQKSSIKRTAKTLLRDVWNNKIKPSWWRWWLASPVACWSKRIGFVLLCSSAIALLFLHFLLSELSISLRLNWIICFVASALLIVTIISPSIERIKASEIEIELRTPPACEFVLPPSVMEQNIAKLVK